MPYNDHESNKLSRRHILGLAAASAVMPLGLAEPKLERKLIWRCQAEVDEMERFGFPEAVQRIVDYHRNRQDPPNDRWGELDCAWSFAEGSPTEGLNTDLASFPKVTKLVSLPHATLPADTPLWYRSSPVNMARGTLLVQADDGAQLWIGQRRIRGNNSFFSFDTDLRKEILTVRVLNKAMHGGLKSVRCMPESHYPRWSGIVARENRIDQAVAKLKRLREPSAAVLEAAANWMRSPSSKTLNEWIATMASDALPIIAPSLMALDTDETKVCWQIDTKQKQSLSYRIGNGTETESTVEVIDKYCTARIKGLAAGDIVAYRIDGCSEARFRVLPKQAPFRFTVWADAHVGQDRFRQTVAQMLRDYPAFTISVGDGVDDASNFDKWRLFYEIGSPLFATTPTYFIGGNHEYDGCFEDLKSPYYEAFALRGTKPWYAWSVGNCRFVALDPNVQFPTGIDTDSEQHRWLLDELSGEANKTAKWRFILIHQPPYSQGWTGYEGDIPIRELLDPLIDSYKIHFVVSGHTHDYERLTREYSKHRCTFLIVGGAGGGLEDGPLTPQPVMETVQRRHHYGRFSVSESKVTFEAVATDGTVLDRFERQV